MESRNEKKKGERERRACSCVNEQIKFPRVSSKNKKWVTHYCWREMDRNVETV